MGQVVYGDILFMIDFSMDFLTFYIVSHILKQKIRLTRVCSASAMGGIYSVISLGIDVAPFLSFVFDIFVCFVMCMTAFLEKSPKRFKKMPLYTCAYFTVSAMLGGVMTALFSILNKTLTDIEGGRDDLSLWVFGFVALLSGLATFLGSDIIGRSSRAKFGKLTVRMGNRKMTFEAMSDSGNMLKDPIGGRDVVIVDRKRAQGLVPDLASGKMTSLPPSIARTVRLIPIRTATGEGILTAFCPDEVFLDYLGEEKRIDVLVALSKEGLGGRSVEAIVSADYFI
ncbi:MAG: sigma-E processing peptidase SpoIIGA [Clostridia bacterium]|nr:sigma-E processing peptidase SpoIIGA [Clostridia bacterium]